MAVLNKSSMHCTAKSVASPNITQQAHFWQHWCITGQRCSSTCLKLKASGCATMWTGVYVFRLGNMACGGPQGFCSLIKAIPYTLLRMASYHCSKVCKASAWYSNMDTNSTLTATARTQAEHVLCLLLTVAKRGCTLHHLQCMIQQKRTDLRSV